MKCWLEFNHCPADTHVSNIQVVGSCHSAQVHVAGQAEVVAELPFQQKYLAAMQCTVLVVAVIADTQQNYTIADSTSEKAAFLIQLQLSAHLATLLCSKGMI